MSHAPRLSVSSLLAATLLAVSTLAVCSASASAAESSPATVSVRVEGLTETKLPATAVTTTTEPVTKDGDPEHSCAGTSAAGALEVATAGGWGGTWFSGFGGYLVETILDETHTFQAGYYWSFWLDEHEASTGVCEAALAPGDRVLFFPASACEECPPALPLGIEAPARATVGEPVAVTVKRYNASGESAPLAGAIVSGGGASETTDAAGRAKLAFAAPGEVVLRASAPESIRAEANVCVHSGDDGTCGTTAPPAPAGSGGVLGQTAHAPVAFVAQLQGIRGGYAYSRRHAPRLLSGSVTAPGPVTSVSLRLRRTYHGRCFAYNGTRELLQRVRCRVGSYFRVASHGGSFSYLLPFALPPGRYVLDADATDAAGQHTFLVRGTSRFVFYVRR